MQKNSRIVIDTNLWISFLLTNNFPKLDAIFSDENIILLFSQELIDEFVEVAQRPKFKKYFTNHDLETILLLIRSQAEFIHVTSVLNICRDFKDNFLLALSADGKATHLITGDKDLLILRSSGDTMIVTMTQFLSSLG